MRPLRVALVVKPSPSTCERELRNMGYWSYPVPEFVWDHFPTSDETMNGRMLKDYDVIFQEDSGPVMYTNRTVPLVYLAIDSTLSDAHYEVRQRRARWADLVLVDHDDIGRFPGSKRLGYCVNDHVFKAREKTLDVSFHCGAGKRSGAPGGEERTNLRMALDGICRALGVSYRSGALGLLDYAKSMGESRIVVNWPRTPINRPHRVFDAMAAGACLVTGRLPAIADDFRQSGVHYVEFGDYNELAHVLGELLENGRWQEIAENGRALVMERHTWAVRARELRAMLVEMGL